MKTALKALLGLTLAAATLLGIAYALNKTSTMDWLSGLISTKGTANKHSRDPTGNSTPDKVKTKRTDAHEESRSPKIAIIIDDIGVNVKVLDELLAIGGPLTFSVLPGQVYSAESAHRIRAAGRELMLHLPMEPRDRRKNPGSGALKTSMSRRRLKKLLHQDLDSLPGVSGVNNHMGSRFTTDRRRMAIVLDVIKSRGLFFVDSRTTSKSVAYSVAKRKGVKTRENDIFLDGNNNEAYVMKQLDKLIELAKARGRALAIGHPRSATISVLTREIPRLGAGGVALVPASLIVE